MSVCVLAILVLQAFLPAQAQSSFTFNKFNASTLYQVDYSSIHSGAICLTNQTQHVSGRILYPHPLRMKYPTSYFSTTFVFAMVPCSSDPSRSSGQGMAFLITPTKSPVQESSTQFLGLLNVSNTGKADNHLFAIEFDTILNEDFQDMNDNHVGVDLNSLKSVKSESAGYWIGNQFHEIDLKSGHNIQAWIDYDHTQQQLNVTIVKAGSPRPQKPLISLKNMTLSDILEEEMYVGFSASTGTVVADHCVLAWSFSTNGSAPELDVSHLPSLLKVKKHKRRLIPDIITALVLVVLLMVGAAVCRWKRNKYRNVKEKWEMEYWPHSFDYKDLHIATKGFRDDQVLGSGGFGRVYKGVLPANGQEVAVKSIFRESSEGLREFIAELSTLGRLQHRNLVQVRGYCRKGAKLFIVYDFMPNGSLDKMIFKGTNNLITWAQRYRILKDVGAGLLYLHEGWEKRVVHRDIKSSNVLLDSEFNAKLGDFGLARLYEHTENPQTTKVMGTLGYIAPELVHTGKATPTADVFSYGVLMLEVACGRKPVDSSLDASEIEMEEWVRELHAEGKLMDAADPKLDGEYVGDEMEEVLKLGLVCCNPQPEARPSIRQVLQIIEGEASLPSLGPYGVSNSSFPSIGVAFSSISFSPEGQSGDSRQNLS